jgi:uncharacterized protein YjaG (DUF416 family)
MSNQELNSIDDFRRIVSSMIKPWSREQRIALAAAMAERWLPVYESYSDEEEWGDPSTFQRALQSVWDCVLGHKLTSKNHRLHKRNVDQNTPHLDDCNDEEVMATSYIVEYALDCCLSADNTNDAIMAMVSCFEGVAPGIYTDDEELPPDFFQSPEIDKLKQAVKAAMDDEPAIDDQEMDEFRQELGSFRAHTPDGVGPLPSSVWESPQVRDQMEKTLKLRKVMSDIGPTLAQHFEALSQKIPPPETNTGAGQASLELWRSPQVQDELEKQLKVLKLIGDLTRIDKGRIEALRERLLSDDLRRSLAPRPSCPTQLTNEAVFEQYRRYIESDLKGKWEWENDQSYLRSLKDNPGAIIVQYIGEWAGRYTRRKAAIEENHMGDVVAHDALLVRNAAHDAAVQGDTGWDQKVRFWIDTCYGNRYAGFDVDAAEKPHRYGPSLRGLWIERKRTEAAEADLWKSLLDWGRHRPPAWEEEDRRKKKGLAYVAPELAERLTRKLSWRATNDVDHPWTTEDAGETWRVRINDFPDDFMYTLIINDAVIGSFHDWPKSWDR